MQGAAVMTTVELSLEGRDAASGPSWVTESDIYLYDPGADPYTDAPLYEYRVSSDESGNIAMYLPSGTFDVRTKGNHTLGSLLPQADLSADGGLLAFTLVEGDFNGDNVIDIEDYSAVTSSIGQNTDDLPAGLQEVDFNEDGIIDISDYNLVLANFGLLGAPPF